ncbi:MAG: type II toxin-antitoxin system PemK/MazF family toxin [Acidimicrobiia bacterium]
MVKRGEVWWADLLDEGTRPALVLTRDRAIPVVNRVVVVPATRSIRRIPTEVLLSTQDGMPEDCALSFDNVSTVPKSLLTSYICTLQPPRMEDVCRAWNDVVDC